jgi:lipoate-protein ligase A
MLCIESNTHDPFFNLASEEYLLKSFQEDLFLLYRNKPSIVVGKHQNTLAELNLSYVLEHGITVARRISGGGTVYHDLGNLNFAFITTGEEGHLVDYKKFTHPLIEAMKWMGIQVSLGSRNELLLNKLKISGTASHVHKQRVLHHGTLLFSASMDHLSMALKASQGKFRDRAVKSIPSPVTNIREHLVDKMGIGDFQNRIMEYILKSMDRSSRYDYNHEDLRSINSLVDRKYGTWEWNFGYSPRYEFRKTLTCNDGTVLLQMQVERGVIRGVSLTGDFMSTRQVHALEEKLTGIIHDPEAIRRKISGIRVQDYITGLDNEELISGMF